MKKSVLATIACILLTATAMAATYPDKMYIKGAWDGSNWVWHTMTTEADGIYTYSAVWNNLYGCNINTSKSDSNSAWYKYNTIVGYDELINGKDVILTYVAACETLYVSPQEGSSVILMLSQKDLYTTSEIELTARCHNIDGPSLSFSMIDPSGVLTDFGTSPSHKLIGLAVGDYTFTVVATPAPGNVGQTQASCSLTRTVTEYVAPEPCPFTPTAEEMKKAYHEDPATHDITFLYDPTTWSKKYDSVNDVFVSGSFNGWSSNSNEDFKLQPDTERKIFYLTVPYNTVKAPGNIGQPEFKFVVNGSYTDPYSSYPSDYIYNSNGNRNMMVVFSFDDIKDVRQTIADAQVIKKLSDFDLTTREGQEEISNYRSVPATTMLKRCYHPFKGTVRTDMSTEPTRLQYVNILSEEDGIKADICLSEDDTKNLSSFIANGQTYQETIPARYQALIDGDHVLYVGKDYKTPSYNQVYYNIRGEYFGRWIKDVVTFINSERQTGPFTIHCRLGSDRTGVFCATLAALCGASWDEIVADYQKTNRMGINEYRSHKLLKFAFEDLLQVTDITEVADFAEAVSNYFIGKNHLNADEITALRNKLNGTSLLIIPDADSKVTVEYYNTSGMLVGYGDASRLAPGIYIERRGHNFTKRLVK